MSNSNKNNISIFVLILITGLLFIILMHITFYFINMNNSAYHNLDMAQNMKYLEAEYNISLIDRASNTKYYIYYELWDIGTEQLFKSSKGLFLMGMAQGLLMGMIFNIFITKK